jgi:O-antigen ligase
VEAVNLGIVGLILIAVGLIGLVLGLFAEMNRRRSPRDPVL